jgi:uncharacterized protein YjbJ (UPF0337 family)
MSAESNYDDTKGRIKEAAGDLTNDRDLKNEGKADRAGAKVKQAGEKVKNAVDDGVDSIKEKLSNDR